MQIVTTHKSMDFDALASVIAATLIYPDALPVIPRSINPNVKAFLSIHKDIFNIYTPDEIDLDQVTRLIVVDVNKWDRLDQMKRLKNKENLEILLWDHHPDKGDINANQVCHEPMGANITLMIRHLRFMNKKLTPVQASLFLTGIHEDTGNLMFPSTMAEDASAAAYLMENKADLNVVGAWLRPAYGEKQKNILFDMLKFGKKMKINGYSICINMVDIEGHVGSLSLVVNMCREILNVDAVFGIFTGKKKGKSIIIGRSNADGLNIGNIMKSMGGGGHPGAGSAMLKFVNPETVKDMIINLIEGNQQSSVQISDIMSFPVVTVPPNMLMKDVGKVLREKGCTGVPVVEEDKIVGIISRRDFRKIKKKSGEQAPVKAFMSRKIITIDSGKSPVHAARQMVKYDIGRLPVVDKNNKLIGIVTRSDAMTYFYDMHPD